MPTLRGRPAARWSRSAAGTACAASLAALRRGRRRPDRGRHGRRRRRLVGPAARASSACCRPATCGMALAALCGDDDWGRTWARRAPAPLRAATARCDGHAVGNLLIVGAVGAARRPRRRRSTGSAGCSAPTGRVLPMAPTPLDIAAEVRGARPGDRDALTHGPRPGRGGHHRRPGRSRAPGARPTRRPARRRSTAVARRRLGGARARARGSPA